VGRYYTLNQQPESLNSKYIDFIPEYNFQVLQDKNKWSPDQDYASVEENAGTKKLSLLKQDNPVTTWSRREIRKEN
jgi:hypothetical protein